MRRFTILYLLIAIIAATNLHAEGKRDKWFRELRQYKQEFLIKELSLSKEQQAKFFPVYDEMSQKLMKLNEATRNLERKIDKTKAGDISDVEYEKGAEALVELKGKEAEIEKAYFQKFKGILKPQQLYLLPKAEKKFTRQLMHQHNKARMDKKRPPKTAFVQAEECKV